MMVVVRRFVSKGALDKPDLLQSAYFDYLPPEGGRPAKLSLGVGLVDKSNTPIESPRTLRFESWEQSERFFKEFCGALAEYGRRSGKLNERNYSWTLAKLNKILSEEVIKELQ